MSIYLLIQRKIISQILMNETRNKMANVYTLAT